MFVEECANYGNIHTTTEGEGLNCSSWGPTSPNLGSQILIIPLRQAVYEDRRV